MAARRLAYLVVTVLVVAAGALIALTGKALPKTPPSHVVIVIMENRGASQIIGSPEAPYFNRLSRQSALFTQSFAVSHPSQPNYLALFSGDTQQIDDNRCPVTIQRANLGQQLIDAGKTFIGFSEGLPETGFTGCTASTGYVRKHAPWVNFPSLPPNVGQPMTAFPKWHFDQLPTLAIVVPNLDNDMHDGSVARGDAWLETNLDSYVQWSRTHNALLIVTWDEDDLNHDNHIPTLFYGPMVKPGVYGGRITHYNVLRTLEAIYGLPYAGQAANATTISGIWEADVPAPVEDRSGGSPAAPLRDPPAAAG
jgi:hypothetical protein